MSQLKKLMRMRFNETTLRRDKRCRLCPMETNGSEILEIHHITNRNCMPNGGYVKENGIALCPAHHLQAEGNVYSSAELYEIIGSSLAQATEASKRAKPF